MTTPETMPRRRRRKKRDANAGWKAIIVGLLLGEAFAALQLVEAMPKWSEVPDFVSVITPAVAVLLVTGALTDRMKTGLLCGAIAATSQFLTLLGFYGYSYTIRLALAVVPLQSLRILMYPAAGVIGGYFGDRTTEVRSVESSRNVRRANR